MITTAGGLAVSLSIPIEGGLAAEVPRRERNMRLREAMWARGVSYADLAMATGRHVKTVQRWVYEGRQPRSEHAAKAATYLDLPVNWLWPHKRRTVNPELIHLYANIAEVPAAVWIGSARTAREVIEIAAVTFAPLPREFLGILRVKAVMGVQVRLCLSPAAAATLRIEGAMTSVSTDRNLVGVYRFDDEMVVWLDRDDFSMSNGAPALHLRQGEDDGVFDFYARLFSRSWAEGDAVHTAGEDWYRGVVEP